jgi:hypothetical protein
MTSEPQLKELSYQDIKALPPHAFLCIKIWRQKGEVQVCEGERVFPVIEFNDAFVWPSPGKKFPSKKFTA